MPFYQKQGEIPKKRHIQYRDKENNLLWEELISRNGFSGIYSNVYHKYPPTKIKTVGDFEKINLKSVKRVHRPHHLLTSKLNLHAQAEGARRGQKPRVGKTVLRQTHTGGVKPK